MKTGILSLVLISCILTTYTMDQIEINPLRTQLKKAILDNDEMSVMDVLSQDIPLNEPGRHQGQDDPPLCIAAAHGSTTIIELLLANYEVEVDITDGNGDTPLHNAVQAGHIRTARMLIDSKSSLTIKNVWGQTVLHQALEARPANYSMVELLLQKNASVNEPDGDGNTPCHLACILNRDDIIELLDENDADWELTNNDGSKPRDLQPVDIMSPEFSRPSTPEPETIAYDNWDELLGSFFKEKKIETYYCILALEPENSHNENSHTNESGESVDDSRE